MTGYLIMKYILFAFVAYFVYLVLASMIKSHRKKKDYKFSENFNEKSFYQTNSKKEIPVYTGGDYTPIQLNKKHPSYQENLDNERKRSEKRREEERKEQDRRRRDNDFNNDYDDSAFETTRRTSSTPVYAYETSSNHHSHSGDSGGHSSYGGDSGGDGGGGGGGGD